MGYFSRITCDTGKPIRCGERKEVYVLIPKEFGGGYITEQCYNGYGEYGGKDIYELVAEWNRSFLSEELLQKEPKLEDFGGLCFFEKTALRKEGLSEEEIEKKDAAERERFYRAALERRAFAISRLNDYRNGLKDKSMRKKYGPDWKREIGIDIACYDEQNAALPYPIKIAGSKSSVYEDCPPSNNDPNQGCL